MSRSEDLIIVRAELSDFSEPELLEIAVVLVANHRRNLWERKESIEHVRSSGCPCAMCESGRYLDSKGLM